ncbi:MAG: MarR family transcriptional regulator [Clostridiales bacterium]
MNKEKLADNLLIYLPIMLKNLTKNYPNINITKQQFDLLNKIFKDNKKTMSYYSKVILISKPNLTIIADKLIKEELIKRCFDPSDRRVILLEITEKGILRLNEYKIQIRNNVLNAFSNLDDEHVKKLNDIVEELKTRIDKMNI